MSLINGYGQLKRGDKISISGKSDRDSGNFTVREVLDSGTELEEIIITKKTNKYFITSMLLDGTSWAKEVKVL